MLSQIWSLLFTSLLVFSTYALSSPPSGAITVGSGQKYATLSAALKDTSSSTYFIYSGSYKEQVLIDRANLKIYGQTNTANNYTGNTVTLTFNKDAKTAGSNDGSATLRVHANNVALYNINIANTYGQGVQAVTLSVDGTQFGAYGVKMTGYQDTFLANSGSLFVSHSYINGATDFIFGQRSALWIQGSTIEVVGKGWITASGRAENDANWYVINQSTVIGSSATYLGRPWRNYARVAFQNTYLPSSVNPAGWSIWNTGDERTDKATFVEYNNSGPGASGTRAKFSSKLSSAVTLTTVFGSSKPSWIDSAFLV